MAREVLLHTTRDLVRGVTFVHFPKTTTHSPTIGPKYAISGLLRSGRPFHVSAKLALSSRRDRRECLRFHLFKTRDSDFSFPVPPCSHHRETATATITTSNYQTSAKQASNSHQTAHQL